MNDVMQCCDCLNHFCGQCDENWKNCPGCKETMCGECVDVADSQGRGECLTCHDGELGTVRFPHERRGAGPMTRSQLRPIQGRLRG